MDAKAAAAKQRGAIIDRAARSPLRAVKRAPEGWIATVRQALSMSGAELARRLGVTRARISKAERSELTGAITLASLSRTAEAMGCKLVYAIVPAKGTLDDLLVARARRKAREVAAAASDHMALEKQGLSAEQNKAEVDRVARDLLRDRPKDFWAD